MRQFDLQALLEALNELEVDAGVIRRGGNVTAMTRFGGLGIPVRVCSLARLREMKQAQDREQDRADLANLPAD